MFTNQKKLITLMMISEMLEPADMDTATLKMLKKTGLPSDGMPLNLESSILDSSTPTLKIERVKKRLEALMTGLFADSTLTMLIFQSSTNSPTSLTNQSATPLRL
jgi:hypothetical protein